MINAYVGRYFYGDSPIHHLDPRIKIISFVCILISIFLAESLKGLVFVSLFLLFAIIISHIPFRFILSYIRPMYWLFLTIIIINLFFSDNNNSKALLSIEVSKEGLFDGIRLVFQFLLVVICSAILAITTMPIQIANAISQILHLRQLPIMLVITLNFVPKLLLEPERLFSIQKARGIKRMQLLRNGKWLIRLALSLLQKAFRLADDIAISMESRCYSGGKRTYLYESSLKYIDILALALSFSLIPIVFVLNGN